GRYVFASRIRCGHCGKSMFGNTAKTKAYYRCAATRVDYATPSVPGHPPTYMVREERIVAAVDVWLDTLTDGEHLDATVDAILAADRAASPEPAEVTRARRQQERLRVELDRILAAIRAGMDPELAAGETRKIQGDIASGGAIIDRWERAADRVAPLTKAAARAVIVDAGGLVGLLDAADRLERAALYGALGLTLRYEKEAPTGQELVH